MPPQIDQVSKNKEQPLPPPTPEQIRNLEQEAKDELFDLQSLIAMTRQNVPPSDSAALQALDKNKADAESLADDFFASFNASREQQIEFTNPFLLEDSHEEQKNKTPSILLREPTLNTETYKQSLETNRESALELTRKAVKEMFSGQASITDLETLISNSNDDEVKEIVWEGLQKKLGQEVTAKIMTDADYRAKLKEQQLDLHEPISKEGPVLLKTTSLEKLIAIQEIFGSHTREMIQAFDLSKHNPDLEISGGKEVLSRVTYALGKNEGERLLEANIDVNISNTDHRPVGNITRGFTVKKELNTKEEHVENKSVRHYMFKLDENYQGKGLAAGMLSESLQVYDKISIQKIKTSANIELGGYVWQGYGFGWDVEEALPGSEGKKEGAEKSLNFEFYIKRKVEAAKRCTIKRLETMGLIDSSGNSSNPEIIEALKQYDKLAESGLSATPQELAHIGIDQTNLRFYRQLKGNSTYANEEIWMTAEELKNKRASGELSEEEASQIEANEFHIGKLGMAHSEFDWEGMIDLTPESRSRTAFEKKLKRATTT